MLLIVRGLRARAENCRPLTGRPEEKIEMDAKRFAYNTLADDLEWAATCPPHEGLAYLRDHFRAPKVPS